MNTRNPSRGRTFYLDAARTFAIFSITCNHAVNRAYENYDNQQVEFAANSLASSILKAGVSVFSRLGAPIFLMITGVLVLSKSFDDEHSLRRYYKNNVLRLLLTAEIWYVLMYWFLVLLDPTNSVLERGGIPGALRGMVETMLFQNQVTMGSMWYMPMILCLYTTIPMAAAAKDRLPLWALGIPLALVFLNNMVLPAVNEFRRFFGGGAFRSALREANLLSIYYLYVFAGFWIGSGKLKKLPDACVALGAVGTFLLCGAYQLFAYSRPQDYLLSYDFPGILICAALVFELFRRWADRIRHFRSGITYLSRISLGIYFVHILIMSLMYWHPMLSLRPSLRMVVMELVSFGGSVLLIWLLSKIPVCRKYLFLIKD